MDKIKKNYETWKMMAAPRRKPLQTASQFIIPSPILSIRVIRELNGPRNPLRTRFLRIYIDIYTVQYKIVWKRRKWRWIKISFEWRKKKKKKCRILNNAERYFSSNSSRGGEERDWLLNVSRSKLLRNVCQRFHKSIYTTCQFHWKLSLDCNTFWW